MIASHIIAVACGGAIGAVSRYFLSSALGVNGILIVNILGCFVIGLLVSFFALKTSMSQTVSLFLTVGLLGGFTTFSAFSLETMALIDTQKYAHALFYIIASVGGGLCAFILGRFLVRLAS
jgi:CrcB protein